MNNHDLKKILRPLIKECIKEVVLEEGLLSGIVSEVLIGVQNAGTAPIVESSTQSPSREQEQLRAAHEADLERRRKIMESRHQMNEAIGKDAYNGVDLFEGTDPIAKAGSPSASPSAPGALAGVDPNDSGVDIGAFFGASKNWSKLV